MTSVEFWTEGDYDAWAEYQQVKADHPAVGRAIREAISLIVNDPDAAEREYSTLLDRTARYLALPFETSDGLTCLIWRQSPDGYDSIQVIDFSEPWTDDLPMPRTWPRS